MKALNEKEMNSRFLQFTLIFFVTVIMFFVVLFFNFNFHKFTPEQLTTWKNDQDLLHKGSAQESNDIIHNCDSIQGLIDKYASGTSEDIKIKDNIQSLQLELKKSIGSDPLLKRIHTCFENQLSAADQHFQDFSTIQTTKSSLSDCQVKLNKCTGDLNDCKMSAGLSPSKAGKSQ